MTIGGLLFTDWRSRIYFVFSNEEQGINIERLINFLLESILMARGLERREVLERFDGLMSNVIMIALVGLSLIFILLIIIWRSIIKTISQKDDVGTGLEENLNRIEKNVKDDFRINREELAGMLKSNRDELAENLKNFRLEMTNALSQLTLQNQNSLDKINKQIEDKLNALTEQSGKDSNMMREALVKAFKDFQESFDKNVKSFNDLQREKFGQLEEKQTKLVEATEKKLEEIRGNVEEKLQKTLTERIGQSFELVRKQLEGVQQGLGEMQNLAQDVGGLKKVLSNVKMRGGMGEVQLAMLLEQILAPEQYESNVKTKKGSNELVEFAIKLPGRDEENSIVWLPIDAKFPKDVYDQLQVAYDLGDITQIEAAQRNLENTVKKMAKDISGKYIEPPNTTDFAIMFLPFEGIYAEVIRKASLMEQLQREFKVIVMGPNTLAVILNALQMGFNTLALQKRSSEVWKILGAVKNEFELFGGLLQKAQNNLHTASNQLDEVMGKRTRAIQRKLRDVKKISEVETHEILPEIASGEIIDDE